MAVQTSRDLAVPDQFHLALVVKQDEPVFFRERLALLDELDEIALVGVGQFVAVGIGACHGKNGFSQLTVN